MGLWFGQNCNILIFFIHFLCLFQLPVDLWILQLGDLNPILVALVLIDCKSLRVNGALIRTELQYIDFFIHFLCLFQLPVDVWILQLGDLNPILIALVLIDCKSLRVNGALIRTELQYIDFFHTFPMLFPTTCRSENSRTRRFESHINCPCPNWL